MAETQIEELDDGRHLVEIPHEDGPVTILVRASPAVTDLFAADGTRVVTATVEYLLARQRPDDLPPQLDIEDVLAAYDDFEGEIRRRLGGV
ncbi:hypothetical protein HDA40_001595 [Hamadaea flava]|uniref:PqqD family protein n=1 Tax=Hamadaea flava TaxID=1742688 RepID=A0ABV8LMV8_9ACTN|nr:hypothetical protein [Hamadaea flava]MCP2323088.1 hypothetical protein [Hamadaea flava]